MVTTRLSGYRVSVMAIADVVGSSDASGAAVMKITVILEASKTSLAYSQS